MLKPKRSIVQRRALMEECRRRMATGESSTDIMAALQIPKTTFYRWSKVMGFRRGDLHPADPRSRVRTPPGPGPTTITGRYLRGEGLGRPRSGGRVKGKLDLTPEQITHYFDKPSAAFIDAQDAIAAGEPALADAIIKAFRSGKARERGIEELRKLATKDPDMDLGRLLYEPEFYDALVHLDEAFANWIKVNGNEAHPLLDPEDSETMMAFAKDWRNGGAAAEAGGASTSEAELEEMEKESVRRREEADAEIARTRAAERAAAYAELEAMEAEAAGAAE